MRMRKTLITLVFILTLLSVFSATTLAYNFTAMDFKTSVLVKINGNEYVVNSVNGSYIVNHFCYGHEKVSISYTVSPLVNITNMRFTVKSMLLYPVVSAFAYYRGLGCPLKLEIKKNGSNYTTEEILRGPDRKPPYKIIFYVNGTLPTVNKAFENYRVFGLYIKNGSKDCFPPVIIRIININKLGRYIHKLSVEIQNLKLNSSNSEVIMYLNNAEEDINAANTLYQSKVYNKAYEKVISAENWLKKAENEAEKLKAESAILSLKTKLDMLNFKLQQIESDLYKIGSKISSSQLAVYLNRKSTLSQEYNQYLEKLNSINSLIDKGNYTEAIVQSRSLMESVNESLNNANSLLNSLDSIISPYTNATATPTTTASGIGFNFKLNNYAIIGGIVVVVIIIAALLYMKGGGGFDELR